jgi:RNA polymerase sigma-70 factor (ECF subfamily)
MQRSMPADPRDLMKRYCDGEAGAFRELHALVSPKLFGYLLHMARDRAIAEDLLQLTFLKVHRARAAYVLGADPLPWIYSIAHRTFLDEARRQKRAIVRVDKEGEVPDIAAEEPAKGPDPELAKAALAALEDLPAQQREAVILTKLDGLSIAQAAEVAGTTPGAMKVRAHRGYVALRKALGDGHE